MSRRHLRFATGFLVELLGLFLLNYHLREVRDGLSDGLGAAAPAALWSILGIVLICAGAWMFAGPGGKKK